MLDEKYEEILEAIWCADEIDRYSIDAITTRCADEAVTKDDFQELAEHNLIVLDGDRVQFTPEGRQIAEGIIRRHRLAEVLVTSILKLKKADMEDVACKVEHCLAPEVEESICTLLGHPDICPDGKRIPQGKCCLGNIKISDNVVVSLTRLQPSERGKITYIKPDSHADFHQLLSFGLQPGAIVTVHRTSPAFCLRFGNTELALDREIAKNIFVWKLKNGS